MNPKALLSPMSIVFFCPFATWTTLTLSSRPFGDMNLEILGISDGSPQSSVISKDWREHVPHSLIIFLLLLWLSQEWIASRLDSTKGLFSTCLHEY